MAQTLVLASKSAGRAALLRAVGLVFDIRTASTDERAVEKALGPDALPADIAQVLAETKALAVADSRETVVIGADQILEDHEGRILHKAETMDEARQRLLHLQGQTHSLHSAFALARSGAILASGVATAHLTMRTMTPKEIGHYLAMTGDDILGSVGCYQIEGPGLRLFSAIDGDHFTIIGMPMLPLLDALRDHGVIDGV